MAPRAFLSFEMEDRWARDFLSEHAKDKRNDIQFIDYSVQDPFDSSWKTQCRERIGRTKGTIVLIGQTTASSAPVLWEITETRRQGHHMFGIQINRDHIYRVPEGVAASDVIRWDFDRIVERLANWT